MDLNPVCEPVCVPRAHTDQGPFSAVFALTPRGAHQCSGHAEGPSSFLTSSHRKRSATQCTYLCTCPHEQTHTYTYVAETKPYKTILTLNEIEELYFLLLFF